MVIWLLNGFSNKRRKFWLLSNSIIISYEYDHDVFLRFCHSKLVRTWTPFFKIWMRRCGHNTYYLLVILFSRVLISNISTCCSIWVVTFYRSFPYRHQIAKLITNVSLNILWLLEFFFQNMDHNWERLLYGGRFCFFFFFI